MSSTEYMASSRAAALARSAGTPFAVSFASTSCKASRSSRDKNCGRRSEIVATPGAKNSSTLAIGMRSVRRRRNHSVPRSTSRPASINISFCTAAGTFPSSASMRLHKSPTRKISRVRIKQRTTSDPVAPVSSRMRCTNTLPLRLMVLLAISVAMISRFKGCFCITPLNFCCNAVGKYVMSASAT